MSKEALCMVIMINVAILQPDNIATKYCLPFPALTNKVRNKI